MAVRDYYVVLGVSRDESPSGIRRAYRERAKRLHPDRAGEGGKGAFQELAEAYGVLSDSHRRREHDRQLDEARGRERPRGGSSPPRAATVEPLAAEEGFAPPGERSVRIPWTRTHARLELVVTLGPAEASRGGVIPVGIPVSHRCPSCRGRLWSRLLCLDCAGTGHVRRVETVAVRYPPRMRSGAVIDLPARASGVGIAVRLRLFVR